MEAITEAVKRKSAPIPALAPAPPSRRTRAVLTFHTPVPPEISLLRSLAERIWRGSYASMISPAQIDYMLALMYSPEKIRAELDAGLHWEIAELDRDPVGFLAVEFTPERIAHLHKLYLLPELQGRGLGQEMLARVVTLAAERAAHEIRLRVNKGNLKAQRAYERAGFQVIDALVADIGEGYVMDDYVLRRPL